MKDFHVSPLFFIYYFWSAIKTNGAHWAAASFLHLFGPSLIFDWFNWRRVSGSSSWYPSGKRDFYLSSFSPFGDVVVRWFFPFREAAVVPQRRTGMYRCAALLRAVQQMADRFLRPSVRLSCISLEPISISGLRISRGPSHIYLKKKK